MIHFLDASNNLWNFDDKANLACKMDKICKIDKIIDIFDKYYMNVVIDGIVYGIVGDELEIESDGYDNIDQIKEYDMKLTKLSGSFVKYCPFIIEDNEYTIILPNYDYNCFDKKYKTKINSKKYSICWIIFEEIVNTLRDEHKTKIRIIFVKKSSVIKHSKIRMMEKIIQYKEIYDQWHEIICKSDVTIIKGKNIYFVTDAKSYEHVMNDYIKTDNGEFVSLLDGSKYDQIYPNIFEPICRKGDEYYINNMCVTKHLYDFDFGQSIKSARS